MFSEFFSSLISKSNSKKSNNVISSAQQCHSDAAVQHNSATIATNENGTVNLDSDVAWFVSVVGPLICYCGISLFYDYIRRWEAKIRREEARKVSREVWRSASRHFELLLEEQRREIHRLTFREEDQLVNEGFSRPVTPGISDSTLEVILRRRVSTSSSSPLPLLESCSSSETSTTSLQNHEDERITVKLLVSEIDQKVSLLLLGKEEKMEAKRMRNYVGLLMEMEKKIH